MNQGRFRLYAELNDLLPVDRRETEICLPSNGDQSVKHLIESLGVPHTEVGQIMVNGVPVDFGYRVQDGDLVAVYPLSNQDSPIPIDQLRFILDNHLGRLAAYLRMLGFDTLYRNDYQDEELASVSSRESRILLTRDKRLLMRNQVTRGYWVRSKAPRKQLEEVVRRYHLAAAIQPFQRCVRCNAKLVLVRKEDVLHRLEPLTRRYFDEFALCPECDQIYWKGSHYTRMLQIIQSVL
jgi:hypothetical protein